MDDCSMVLQSNTSGANIYNKFIRIAEKYAIKSNHRQHKLATLIVRGSNILSIGWNKDHQHAEHCAINRAWRSDISGCTAITVRVRRDGTLGVAKPCDLCARRLVKAGIDKVVYTNSHGHLVVDRLIPNQNQIYLQYKWITARNNRS